MMDNLPMNEEMIEKMNKFYAEELKHLDVESHWGKEAIKIYADAAEEEEKRISKTYVRAAKKVHNNYKCPCDSGLKYKNCCK